MFLLKCRGWQRATCEPTLTGPMKRFSEINKSTPRGIKVLSHSLQPCCNESSANNDAIKSLTRSKRCSMILEWNFPFSVARFLSASSTSTGFLGDAAPNVMRNHTTTNERPYRSLFPHGSYKNLKKKTWNEDEPSEEINNRWRVASRCSEYCPTRKASSWSSGLLHSSPERGYPKAYASEILNRRNRFRCINIPLITYDKNSLQKFFSYRKFVYDNVCNLFL